MFKSSFRIVINNMSWKYLYINQFEFISKSLIELIESYYSIQFN